MIQSMTAFSRIQVQGAWGSAVCELRSINHRYLEMNVRLPEALHELEVLIRERVRHHIKRGKIECHIRFVPGDVASSEIIINKNLAEQLCRATDTVAQMLKHAAPVNPVDILHWPGILQMAEVDLEIIQDQILQVIETGLIDLVEARSREGAELKVLFLQRLESMKGELAKVREHLPDVLKSQRERLIARFKDAKLELIESELIRN